MTLDEFSSKLKKKYGGFINVGSFDKKTTDTIYIDGWYCLEELESMVTDIKAWNQLVNS